MCFCLDSSLSSLSVYLSFSLFICVGVMYGDIGHGILLSLAAYSLIHFEAPLLEKQKKGQLNEILGMAFGGRYIIFMMGLFATYCGMVYNDCLSIPLNVYGSTWTPKANTTDEVRIKMKPQKNRKLSLVYVDSEYFWVVSLILHSSSLNFVCFFLSFSVV